MDPAMPVATELLTPMLRRRLEASLPPAERSVVCKALRNLLCSVQNLPAITHTLPPTDGASVWPMARIYHRLVTPGPGAQSRPLNACERRAVHLLHYLHEVERAVPLGASADPTVQRPQSQIHAHLLGELRREFRLLPCPVPQAWRELAIIDVAAKLLADALQKGVQPTEVRVVAAQELAPEPGRHRGGLHLHLAAWNGATPPEHSAASADPNVWDPNNPLGNELDLLRAPVQIDWAGVTPPAHH